MTKFHSDAADLIFAADANQRHRLVLAMTGQMTRAALVEWRENYEFGDFNEALLKHGAVVEFESTRFCKYPSGMERAGHPQGAEPGDWYSPEPVSVEEIVKILSGQEMLDWLTPSEGEFRYRLRGVLSGEASQRIKSPEPRSS